VEGAEVSAVLREDASLVVRVHNPSPEPSVVSVAVDGSLAHGDVVDLRGTVLDSFPGTRELGSWEIATFRLS
jgi:alpha-mannosidase